MSVCCRWLLDTLNEIDLYFRLILKKSKRKSAHHLIDKAQGAINKCYQNKICPLILYSPPCYFLIARLKYFYSRHVICLQARRVSNTFIDEFQVHGSVHRCSNSNKNANQMYFVLKSLNFIYIIPLYMFRTPLCPSSGASQLHMQSLVPCGAWFVVSSSPAML